MSEQSEPTERLLDRWDLFRRARILYGRGSRRYEAELLFAVQNPYAFGYEAVLTRDPFPDFLIGAHAQIQANHIAAIDRGYLRRYFPRLRVLKPAS